MVPYVAARKTHQRLQKFWFAALKDFCNNISVADRNLLTLSFRILADADGVGLAFGTICRLLSRARRAGHSRTDRPLQCQRSTRFRYATIAVHANFGR
jgi:hypothetical protein